MKKQIKTITAFAMTLTIAQWSEKTGIKATTLKPRIARAKEDQNKIQDALTNGASDEFILSITPKKKGRKPREEQTISVDLTGGSVTIKRRVNNSIEVLDSEGKALNAAKVLSEINTEKELGINLKKADGTRRYNTRSLGQKVIEALSA